MKHCLQIRYWELSKPVCAGAWSISHGLSPSEGQSLSPLGMRWHGWATAHGGRKGPP